MDGKLCIVTGATSGIGRETARKLARLGARVGVVGRSPSKVEEAAKETGGDALVADFSSLSQVRGLAKQILDRYERVDVLINNAGVYRMKRSTTPDGFEETFAVNHLAPYLLTNLLIERLRESAPARVVTVASNAHVRAELDFEDLMQGDNYSHWKAYSRSKLANIMFTYALARRLDGTGVTANCMHPGFVASNFGSGNTVPSTPVMRIARPLAFSPSKAAELVVWLAASPQAEGVHGRYYFSTKFGPRNRDKRSNAFSYDVAAQERLWEKSAALTGL